MTNDMPRDLFEPLMGCLGVFAICALWRVMLVRRIVRATGGTWDLNTPFKRVGEERKALRNLPPGKLRNQLRFVTGLGISSWLLGAVIMFLHAHNK